MGLLRDYIDGYFRGKDEGEVGIHGFTAIAIIRDNTSQTREAPITYLEDGSHVNDHIIRNPLNISIEGNVSDIFVRQSPVLQQVRAVETVVGGILTYTPNRTQAQASIIFGITADIQQRVDQVDRAIRTGQNVTDFLGFTGQQGKTNIEKFIDHMAGLMESDVLINIDGPGRVYSNMCITSFDYEQGNTVGSLDFKIEAQELRFAQTIFSEVVADAASGTNGQHAGVTDKGAQEGKEVEASFLKRQLDRFGGR